MHRKVFAVIFAAFAMIAPLPARPNTLPALIRLDASVIPRRYQLDLTIDPNTADFAGKAKIDVDLSRPLRRIVLHAAKLKFDQVSVDFGPVSQRG